MIYSYTEFNYDILNRCKTIAHRGKTAKRRYLSIVSAFDIETTSVPENKLSFMYIWQWAFGSDCYIGRTWEEFRIFANNIIKALDGRVLVVYVHNLSFEFQYLKSIFCFESDNVFALSTRKVAKAEYRGIEFRCSYVLTNMSLAEFTDKMNVQHKKLDDFVYDEIRYPWTELSNREIEYVVNDVLGLVEALTVFMLVENDTLVTIPMTSTGFVRRDVRQSMQLARVNTYNLNPSIPLYTILRECFRGGNTHSNRWYTGMTIEEVNSYDRSSSYPDVLVNHEFPIKQFIRMQNKLPRKRCPWCARVKIEDIKLASKIIPIPYISYSKCLKVERDSTKAWLDNGRILEARLIILSITDIDFEIISKQYTWTKFEILEIWGSEYGKLPEAITDVILHYYERKTILKGKAGEEVFYMKAKNKLNSIYGMMAQNPGKLKISFVDNMLQLCIDEDISEIIDKYYKRSFTLPYQWGVWTTAWARWELQQGIDLVGEDCVYVDTDSVKFLGSHDFSTLNNRYMQSSKKNGAYAKDSLGKIHYMGIYEKEKGYELFKTWGAKKYAYVNDGVLNATIAGVATRSKYKPKNMYGGKELEKAGGLDAFKPGFVFTDSAGNEVTYNEVTKPYMLEIGGGSVEITSNVFFSKSTYTLSLTNDYQEVLLNILMNLE